MMQSYENYGFIQLNMFTCPNGDATDLVNDAEACLPDRISKDQILIQRLQKILNLFLKAKLTGVPIRLNLFVGDVDFITYYSPALRFKNILLDRDKMIDRARSLSESISRYLGEVTRKFEGLFLVNTYSTSQNTLCVRSLLLNTQIVNEFGSGVIDQFDPNDLIDQGYFTGLTLGSNRFDPIMADLPEEVKREVVLSKFQDYRNQGRIIAENGGILICDELPYAMKSRMFGSDLLYLFPWVRKEDPIRNPDFQELGGQKFKLPSLEG